MGGGGGGDEGEFGLQIAPMLDLLFVLLIFFMSCAGAQIKEAELGIKIPSNQGGTPKENDITPVQLDVDQFGQVYFNKAPMDTPSSKEMPGLKSKLIEVIAKHGDQSVIIAPTTTARHERVMDILNACSAAKVKNLAFGASTM
jgi:biopolymer transport protein ExbD